VRELEKTGGEHLLCRLFGGFFKKTKNNEKIFRKPLDKRANKCYDNAIFKTAAAFI